MKSETFGLFMENYTNIMDDDLLGESQNLYDFYSAAIGTGNPSAWIKYDVLGDPVSYWLASPNVLNTDNMQAMCIKNTGLPESKQCISYNFIAPCFCLGESTIINVRG